MTSGLCLMGASCTAARTARAPGRSLASTMAAWNWPLLSRALVRCGSVHNSTRIPDSTKERVSTLTSFSFWLTRSALGCMKVSILRVTALISFLLGFAAASIVIKVFGGGYGHRREHFAGGSPEYLP